MKKVLMTDYYGTSDEYGSPIGHSLKVLNEYSELIRDEYDVALALSPCLARNVENQYKKVYYLKYDINLGYNGIFSRIYDKYKLLYNIRQAIKVPDVDIIWFYRTDFFFYFYMLFLGKNKRKIIGLTCQNEFGIGKIGKILNFLFNKGARHIDGLIYTQRDMQIHHKHALYIPDYYYDESKYEKFIRDNEKEDIAVCLGTMSPYKKLEELVESFNKNGMKLVVKGKFYNKDRATKLQKQANDNVKISDEIISDEEYYTLMAKAKYVILPYDMEQYVGRTSGVLQECLFMNTIPVAPNQLLSENRICGIGYDTIDELMDFNYISSYRVDMCANENLLDEYCFTTIQKKIIKFIKEI